MTGTGRADSGASSLGDAPLDPLDDRPDTSTRSESAEPKQLVLSTGPLRDVARGIVMGLGQLAHHTLARTDEEQEAGLWTFSTAKEAGEIADPATSIVERHLGTARVPADLADAVAMVVAAAGYAIKNGLEAVRLRRGMRRTELYPPTPEE